LLFNRLKWKEKTFLNRDKKVRYAEKRKSGSEILKLLMVVGMTKNNNLIMEF